MAKDRAHEFDFHIKMHLGLKKPLLGKSKRFLKKYEHTLRNEKEEAIICIY